MTCSQLRRMPLSAITMLRAGYGRVSEKRTGDQNEECLASQKRKQMRRIGAERRHDGKASPPVEHAEGQDQPGGAGRHDHSVTELETRQPAEIDGGEARSDELACFGDVAHLGSGNILDNL